MADEKPADYTSTNTGKPPKPAPRTNSALEMSDEEYQAARERLTGVDGTHLDYRDINFRSSK